jgi:hypothetical protein
MNLRQLYQEIVRAGAAVDPRPDKRTIRSFADTALLYGAGSRKVRSLLAGIDIDVGELLLADRLRGELQLDAVVSHHPQGSAYAALPGVMQLQSAVLKAAGADISGGFLDERRREVERKLLPANHMRSVDAARLLDMPFLCAHTPADNHAYAFVRALLAAKRPRSLQDIVKLLLKEPEYAAASRINAGPRILLGSGRAACGKVLVEMTGGTEGHAGLYTHLYEQGVRTLVCMHLSEDHFRKVSDTRLQVIIAGHIASDTLGMNLLFDALLRKAPLKIHGCSGFQRFSRT